MGVRDNAVSSEKWGDVRRGAHVSAVRLLNNRQPMQADEPITLAFFISGSAAPRLDSKQPAPNWRMMI
jgi:hypothetical protein